MAAHAATLARRERSVELVWTRPDGEATPLRRTDQALLQLIDGALHELLIVTFAIYRIETIAAAIVRAGRRGVAVRIVVESPDESEGKIARDALAALGPDVVERARIFVWPLERRPTSQGRHGSLHVKCAVADRGRVVVSSANLTAHALTLNMEMGVLIGGGELPERVARHFDRLIEAGILRPAHTPRAI
jgi:phosphatidylserine/phosphatidylglycerophosphate/cardiolipin synthase-like enzyme